MVRAEVLIDRTVFDEVVDDDEHAVGHGHSRSPLAASRDQTVVLGGEVAVSNPSR
jgi:hypothetical protein